MRKANGINVDLIHMNNERMNQQLIIDKWPFASDASNFDCVIVS